MLGAGGAARAVCLALIEAEAQTVLLTGRSPQRLDKLGRELRDLTSTGITLTWTHWQDGVFMTVLPKADLLVNCTPVGTRGGETEGESPIADEFLPANGTVFDLVYNPPETPLLKAAKAKGAKAVSGLGMLVYQAAESFRLWTGQEAPIDQMLEAGRQALKAEASGKASGRRAKS